MSSIVRMYDASNNDAYPITHLRAVRDSNGTTLESMIQGVNETTVGYYECTTAGSTPEKTITIDSSVSLSVRISCKVKFAEKNTGANATMNINNTGAKPLFYNGVRAAANNSWYTNEIVDLYFDGTNYQAKSCADTLEYDVSLHQTHEITEVTTTTRTVVYNGDVTSGWENETSVSDSSVNGYTRTETNTGKDNDTTTVDGPTANYNSAESKTSVVYVTKRTLTHVVNDYTFDEAVNAVPMSYRHGGLKLSFISNNDGSLQNSDNKYVQYRLMANEWSTTVSDWQGVDDEPTTGSNNLVKSGGVYADVNRKVDKNADSVTVISDDSDAFYIVDSACRAIVKIDATGIYSPNINGMVLTINNISGNVSDLAELVSSIFNAEVENIFEDNSSEFLVTDRHGYIGLKVSNRGVEGVFLNTNTGGGIKNDLRKQNNLTPVIGNYGGDNAVYKLSGFPKVFRIAFDFRLNDNINIIGTDKPFVRLVGSSIKDVKPLHAVPTDLLVSLNGETYTAVSQVIGFNSGFNVCGTSFVRSPFANKPIVGDTVFSLWLKGNFNEESDFPTEQEVLERALWLSSHSTAKIIFSNDTFSVQGVSENAINVSIKDGNVYKSLGVFYDDLVSALGDYFVFKKLRLSASKTTADLLQFGELKLVSNYWQQTNKASTSLSYNYDSFPVSIPLAIDETLHTVEIIGADGNVWVSVDGQFVKYSDTLKEIYIGGTETESGLITCSNLEYDNGSLGDAIIDSNYGIVSNRTPRVIGVMQHLIEDKYEGETLTQEYYSSVSRMLDIFRMIENRGYTILTLNDVCLWLSGRKSVPTRSIFFLATTNPTYDKFLNDLLSRRIWTGSSVPFIIGSIIEEDVTNAGGVDELFKQVVSARAVGVDYITHLYDHDVLPDYKNSLILQQELYKLIRLCIASGIDTRVYSYGWSCKSVNYYNMLSLNGFIGAMGNGNPSISAGNKYNLGRVNISDAMSISNLSKILI